MFKTLKRLLKNNSQTIGDNNTFNGSVNQQIGLGGNNGWISVDDALPPNGGDFWLVFTETGRTSECRYFSDEWITTYCNNERVTHWQPLPLPPNK